MVLAKEPLAEGRKLLAAGKYAAAAKLLQEACQLQPDDLAAGYDLGRAAFESADYETAIVAFERILIKVPDAQAAKLQLARVHAKLGSRKIAWAYFRSANIKDLPLPLQQQVQTYADGKGEGRHGKRLEALLAAAASHEEKVRPFAEVAKRVAAASLESSISSDKAGSEKDAVGFVAVVRGKVKVTHPQRGERILKVKSGVFRGDTIVTARGEGVQVVFTDNSVIRLGSNSTYAIDRYQWNAEKKQGEMKATIKEGVFSVMGGLITKASPDKFTLETPAATIGVRGSMFSGSYLDEQFNVVFVGGTGIYVAKGGETTDITQPGYGVEGVFGGAFSEPAEMSEELLSQMLEGLPYSSGEIEENFDIIHHRAYACFNNPDITFEDDPTPCEAVCGVCHKGESRMAKDEDINILYTVTFCEAEPNFAAADLTIAGGTLVTGSLKQVDATHWSFQVKLTGSTTDLSVTINEAKCVASVIRKGATKKIVEGQIQNPELPWTDMVYPGHYPGSPSLSSSNSYEQNWKALPAHHKVCRECHPDQTIDAHNHPIFVNMALDFGNDQVEELGLILCTSCHDPHSNQSALLRLENGESKLCQYCHGK